MVKISKFNVQMTVFLQQTLQKSSEICPRLTTVSQLSVSVNHFMGKAHDRAQVFGRKFSASADQVSNLERAVPNLAPLYHLMDPGNQLDKDGLVAAGKLLDVLASKTSGRVNWSCDPIVFDIPDPIPFYGLGEQRLEASGMDRVPFLMTRLRRRTKRHSCPFLLQFRTKILAKLSIGKLSSIAATIPVKNKINCRWALSLGGVIACTSHNSSHAQFVSKMPSEDTALPVKAESSKTGVVSTKHSPTLRSKRNPLVLVKSMGFCPISSLAVTFQPPSKNSYLGSLK